ncbi:hypothetical protein DFP73DRAFT_537920 [Morchella snyderi]|nr:hypothetical protein DFP73DRAFT_537920 [Morchella snyderi]
MPPRKRKATPVDSDYESPPKNKASRGTTSSQAKRRPPAQSIKEISTYVAKTMTPEYTIAQLKTCQNIQEYEIAERCVTCIEKQSDLGTCRFVNLRAFKTDAQGQVDTTDYAFGFVEVVPKPKPVKAKAAPKRKKKVMKPEIITTRRTTRLSAAGDSTARVVSNISEVENTQVNSTSEKQQADAGDALAAASDKMDDKTDDSPVVRHTLTSDQMKEEADYVLPLIAPVFAEHLRREKHHEFTHLGLPTGGKPLPGGARPLFRVPSSPNSRSLCDACSTSIYMGSYLCGCCGKEMCLGCWEEWVPSDIAQGSRIRRIDTCSRRRRHIRDSMLFMTRAAEGGIVELLERVEARVPSEETQKQEQDSADTETDSIPTSISTWPNDKLKYLATPKTHHKDITLQQFRSMWRRGGIPLVLTGFLDRFKLPWDPKYFTRRYGSVPCNVHDCEHNQAKETNVEKFFRGFNNSDITHSYKLKDWPPSANFSETFPELFKDFENAIPFPSYISRAGSLNLAAHFPPQYIAPDLGPKMYNAFPAPDFLPKPSGETELKHRPVKGTTNLHLDLTDAVNIMLFSAGGEKAPPDATTPKDIPFCGAIWDIFPPSASTHLRKYLNSEEFLKAHEGAMELDDPIHRQVYYLTEEDMIKLYEANGVMAHRIYQEPGEAVFIPAGCAHQVRNRRSCVKVAVDFLTPENVKVCKDLVAEARVMGNPFLGRATGGGKEDVLQLWSCLGFAWDAFDGPRKGPGKDGEAVKKDEKGEGEGLGIKADDKMEENGNGNGSAEHAARIEVETTSNV